MNFINNAAFRKLALKGRHKINPIKMSRYIVRTGRGKTHLFKIDRVDELIGYINYDFLLRKEKLPVKVRVITPNGVAGYVETFYPSEICIRVYDSKGGEIAYLNRSGDLRIDGVYVSFNQLSREETILSEEKEKTRLQLKELGLNCCDIFNDSQVRGKIYCFSKKNDISTLLQVYTSEKPGIVELLRFLPLAIAKRVFEQEFIRRFITVQPLSHQDTKV